MVDGGRLAVQLVRIVAGFICALIAAGLFLAWGVFRAGPPEVDPVGFGAMVGTGLVSAAVLGSATFVPALAAILLAELAGWRSIVYHVGAAGLIAFALWLLRAEPAGGGLPPGTPVALAAGFLAGAVYWLVAGRRAGLWKVS
ncbi:hypothetical protein [Polymorphum gilvum]|uniref:Translation initiation factor IF-3 n=1 Tax=Polymorphum gilvum (strain LMG 25793 / CGMCC 1.9160 / SL003B-26A1) TaxID=991905 RepID=F2J311_POLGS|nr:hypothetical protein [Polymorphum gilvum]ADZ68881.1 Translation initiation factor IF-3 [Polymorphum gilvum SL003B-26A1]